MRRGRNAYHLCDYLISVSRQRLRRGTRWAVLAVPGSAARRTALRSFSALPPGRGGHHLGCRVRGDAVGRPRLAPDSHRGGGATAVVTPPVRFPGCEPARGGHCDYRHCPRPQWDPAGFAVGQATGQPWRGRRAPSPTPGTPTSGSARTHLPAARASTPCRRPRPAPGITHHRNGG